NMEECGGIRTDGSTLLRAVLLGRLRLTRLLLEGGAYINESNERGETPLMVACVSRHVDAQSAAKAKMVAYLLENGADPNIQDKCGRSALMHACIAGAGAELAQLLLTGGADPSLEDRSGASALVYAINTDDKDTLKVLLDACKAKGKDVIIITTDKSASGGKTTKQYLNVPPSPADFDDRFAPVMSPSDIELRPTFSNSLATATEDESLMSLPAAGVCGRKGTPKHCGTPKLLPQLQKTVAHGEDAKKAIVSLDEELSSSFSSLLTSRSSVLARHFSMDVADDTFLGTYTTERRPPSSRAATPMCHRSPHMARRNTLPVEELTETLTLPPVCSLQEILRQRQLGINHYHSDTQLQAEPTAVNTLAGRFAMEQRKRHMSSSRDSLDGWWPPMAPASGERRGSGGVGFPAEQMSLVAASTERRGSGGANVLMEQLSHSRISILPPIPISVTPTASGSASEATPGFCKQLQISVKPGVPPLPCSPSHREVKGTKKFPRRHSMQVEQMKLLLTHGDGSG
uniref:Ankyrin repeat domain 34A n=1 Tax=Petromyzon marinus TaxID=7757 RepID=S4S0V5_PETMA